MDLKNSDTICEMVPDVQISSMFATANSFNGQPVYCGGDQTPQNCFVLDPETLQWVAFAAPLYERRNHASVQLSEDSFWLLGNIFKYQT